MGTGKSASTSNEIAYLVDAQATAILLVADDMQVIEINESAERLLNISRNQLLSTQISELLFANETLLLQSQSVLSSGQAVVLRDLELHLPQLKRPIRADISITPITNSQKRQLLIEIHEMAQSVTWREDEMQSQQFIASMTLLKSLSHEIKNPLAGIRGAAQLLSKQTAEISIQNQFDEYTDVIIREVDRIDSLLNRRTANKRSLELKVVDIHGLIEHCLHLLSSEYGSGIVYLRNYDTSLPELSLDSDQTIQALLNVLINAAQAIDKQGIISITSRVAFANNSRKAMPQTGVKISIWDSGSGVSEADRERIFLPMMSNKHEGSGLGLAIAQEIMQLHGGFIRLDRSAPQSLDHLSGASFSLFFPLKNNSNSNAQAIDQEALT